jgi:ketosteroid isomerase-like protein
MKTQEIANNLVTWYNAGEDKRCYNELYSPNIVSIEASNDYPEANGMEAVAKKGEWWYENFEVHSTKASQPIVADNWFSVRFDMDTTHKPSGQRTQTSELGVYRVQDGKIVREQFFYDQE